MRAGSFSQRLVLAPKTPGPCLPVVLLERIRQESPRCESRLPTNVLVHSHCNLGLVYGNGFLGLVSFPWCNLGHRRGEPWPNKAGKSLAGSLGWPVPYEACWMTRSFGETNRPKTTQLGDLLPGVDLPGGGQRDKGS